MLIIIIILIATVGSIISAALAGWHYSLATMIDDFDVKEEATKLGNYAAIALCIWAVGTIGFIVGVGGFIVGGNLSVADKFWGVLFLLSLTLTSLWLGRSFRMWQVGRFLYPDPVCKKLFRSVLINFFTIIIVGTAYVVTIVK